MLLSIIIPVYRTADTLDRCIESVLAQAGNSEIILVDDGSPDVCPQLCDEWAGRDSRICVIHQANQGLSGARNTGIERSRGQYLAFIDSDDTMAPSALPKLMELLKAHPEYDLTEFQATIHYGTARAHTLPLTDGAYTDWRQYWTATRGYTHTYAWNKLYRRTLFDHIRFPLGHTFEDVLTIPSLLQQCHVIGTTTIMGYHYYDNPNGITHQASGHDLANLLEGHCHILPLVSNADYCAHVLNIALDVHHATGRVLQLPQMPYWQTPKLLAHRLLGLKLLCKIHLWITRHH